MKGNLFFFRRQLTNMPDIPRRGVLAKHFNVSAKRNNAELPTSSILVGSPEQLRAEADREYLNAHIIVARDQKMPEFMEEDEHRQNHKKGKRVIEDCGNQIHKFCRTAELTPSTQAAGRLPPRYLVQMKHILNRSKRSIVYRVHRLFDNSGDFQESYLLG